MTDRSADAGADAARPRPSRTFANTAQAVALGPQVVPLRSSATVHEEILQAVAAVSARWDGRPDLWFSLHDLPVSDDHPRHAASLRRAARALARRGVLQVEVRPRDGHDSKNTLLVLRKTPTPDEAEDISRLALEADARRRAEAATPARSAGTNPGDRARNRAWLDWYEQPTRIRGVFH